MWAAETKALTCPSPTHHQVVPDRASWISEVHFSGQRSCASNYLHTHGFLLFSTLAKRLLLQWVVVNAESLPWSNCMCLSFTCPACPGESISLCGFPLLVQTVFLHTGIYKENPQPWSTLLLHLTILVPRISPVNTIQYTAGKIQETRPWREHSLN